MELLFQFIRPLNYRIGLKVLLHKLIGYRETKNGVFHQKLQCGGINFEDTFSLIP
jgi:hypothetical protein